MDPFNAFFHQWGGVFQLISIILAATTLTLYVYNFIQAYDKKVAPKVEKPKAPKVKAEKVNKFNLVIKDDHNVIIFNTNYQTKHKAKVAVKSATAELYKANKNPNTYHISKIK